MNSNAGMETHSAVEDLERLRRAEGRRPRGCERSIVCVLVGLQLMDTHRTTSNRKKGEEKKRKRKRKRREEDVVESVKIE